MPEVELRPARIEDAEAIHHAARPENLRNFRFYEKPVSLEDEIAWLAEMTTSRHDQVFVVLLEGRIIGSCGLHEIDWKCLNTRIGIMIFDPSDRGHGLGSRAGAKLLSYAFKRLDMYKLYLKVLTGNRQSLIMDINLGFEFEARLVGEYRLGDEYLDMNRMYMTRDMWPL